MAGMILKCGHDTPGLCAGNCVGCLTCGQVTNFNERICPKCRGNGTISVYNGIISGWSKEKCWRCNGEGKVQ